MVKHKYKFLFQFKTLINRKSQMKGKRRIRAITAKVKVTGQQIVQVRKLHSHISQAAKGKNVIDYFL